MRHLGRLCRTALLAVVAGAGVAALVACEPEQLGSAATVGDAQLSISQVQRQVELYADSLPTEVELARLDTSSFQRKIVQDWLRFELVDRVAQAEGIEISPAEVDRAVDAERERAGGDEAFSQAIAQQGFTEETLRDAVQAQLVVDQLGGDEAATEILTAEAASAGAWVSPRFGTLDGVTIAETSGSLSVPTSPEPTPAE